MQKLYIRNTFSESKNKHLYCLFLMNKHKHYQLRHNHFQKTMPNMVQSKPKINNNHINFFLKIFKIASIEVLIWLFVY